jgi:hypothetical protein
VVWLLKCEVGEPIVNEIDFLTLIAQPTAAEGKLGSVGNDCPHSVLCQNSPRQFELSIKKLLLRAIVHDRDLSRRATASLPQPLFLEHLTGSLFETDWCIGRESDGFSATGPLSSGKHRI